MDTQVNNSTQNEAAGKTLTSIVESATPLTPLELNNFKLDVRHTVLTPEYLENLSNDDTQNVTQS